ncbi:hypothetical protein [Pseudoteredinibacter isoporae]|uniref:PepSY-associated transmembrane protein n=1 Tax=Pseudoteredinibacter isoporae TaxID=570281 RepID=A0A7X0MZ80_9GAMM|nr:hypothetical protein [Pseudoteredinibacter isoporae]MBB6522857.1 hypothetical protein [Pseudoteredinibacter isoporae]NHO88383.1 hypothetical protein [Pseudoteredinibacter isoporae]NIB23286.1 hypothetical protein [Pseudoteredinibacter isoporae]
MGQRALQSFMRRWHRRLAIVIGLQFLAWTLGGAYFAWFHIDNVRGQYERKAGPSKIPLNQSALGDKPLLTISELSPAVKLDAIHSVELINWRGQWAYWFKQDRNQSQLIHAQTGALLSPIDETAAIAIAQEDFAHDSPVLEVNRLSEHNGEYKGPLPAYQVKFDHPKNSHLYVHENSGRVTARRNWVWRGFDFLWMLHILDFNERENFNNWALRVLSILGLITLFSGYGLWFLTSLRWRSLRMRILGP